MSDQVALCPVVGWASAILSDTDAAFIRLHYLVSPGERATQPHTSPDYGFDAAQLRKLAERFLELAAMLEAPQPGGARRGQH